MAYKNRNLRTQVSLDLNNEQKIKLHQLGVQSDNGNIITLSKSVVIGRIVSDYLDSLPSVDTPEGAAAIGCDESVNTQDDNK